MRLLTMVEGDLIISIEEEESYILEHLRMILWTTKVWLGLQKGLEVDECLRQVIMVAITKEELQLKCLGPTGLLIDESKGLLALLNYYLREG